MATTDYLTWLSESTSTRWWHDSADPRELDWALAHGAVGVTTNPFLVPQALAANREKWGDEIGRALREAKDPRSKAESLMRIPVTHAAKLLAPIFERTRGESGWVCAQVDPGLAGDRTAMEEMAGRFAAWAPNIAVKLPVTAAGLDVLERCCAAGITVTATVSFSVAQAVAVAERHRRAAAGTGQGRAAGRCFAVLMIGRLDDYLREVFGDSRAGITEAELQQAGLAAAKRACAIYAKEGFAARLMIAAFRQTHQVAGMSGGPAVLSIHPRYQRLLTEAPPAREEGFGNPVPPKALEALGCHAEFRRAYEVDGLKPEEFISFGLTQRTLAQFSESGWRLLESFEPAKGEKGNG